MKTGYVILALVGAIAPLTLLLPWLFAHGLDIPLLIKQAVSAPISAFAWLDVVISALAVLTLVVIEGRRLAMPRWWSPALGCLIIGPSLGLPLFLFMREQRLTGVA